MTHSFGVQCSGCLCDMQPTAQYGADVQRCPRCGGLWLGHRGMQRLQAHLHDKRHDVGLGWREFGSLLADNRRPSLSGH